MPIIAVQDLNIRYGDKHVIKGLSISFEKNKITSIIGPSGCGKSTFLISLNLMLKEHGGSYEGDISFKGRDINSYNKANIRKALGLVLQKPSPFPLSIYNNMTYALKYYGVRDKKILKDLVVDNLQKVGLFAEINDELNMSALKLSGGQQQRLSIARALTVNPEVLLLDEPCSSLDIRNTALIEDLLGKLSQEYTIIIVTHNLAQAKRISDYTAFIDEGKLIEYGKTEAIFSNPKDRRTLAYIEGRRG